ncbi:predicted protein, partial [Naegleria gruberi]
MAQMTKTISEISDLLELSEQTRDVVFDRYFRDSTMVKSTLELLKKGLGCEANIQSKEKMIKPKKHMIFLDDNYTFFRIEKKKSRKGNVLLKDIKKVITGNSFTDSGAFFKYAEHLKSKKKEHGYNVDRTITIKYGSAQEQLDIIFSKTEEFISFLVSLNYLLRSIHLKDTPPMSVIMMRYWMMADENNDNKLSIQEFDVAAPDLANLQISIWDKNKVSADKFVCENIIPVTALREGSLRSVQMYDEDMNLIEGCYIYVHHLYDCALNSFKNNPNAKVVKIQLGTFSQIHISNDENLIREILVKKYKTVSKGNLFEPVGIFGPNIFSADSNDPIWRKHRTLANPIFSSSSHLKNVFRVTLEECKKMIKFWKSIYGSESDGTIRKVNISNELKSITLDVINRVAFDYDVGIFDKDAAHRDGIHDWINNLLNGLIYNFVLPKYLFEIIPFGFFKRYKDAKEKFKQATYSMIEKKQQEFDDHTYLEKDDEDLLTLLLKSSAAATKEEEKLSKSELLSAIFIVLFAGFE